MDIIHREHIDLNRLDHLCAVGSPHPPLEDRDRSLWHVTNLLISGREIIKGECEYYEGDRRPRDVVTNGLMAMGNIWEALVDRYLDDYAHCLGGTYLSDLVYEKDGISGSLDGFMVLPGVAYPLICESKWRFTMSDDIPLDHQQQMGAYCYLADTPLVCYISGHVCSNPPMISGLMRFLRLPRPRIEEIWRSILNTKHFLESKGKGPRA
jgi:hypothetical protein